MTKIRGIAFKLVFFVLLSVSVIFIIIFAYNYSVSKKIIIKNIESSAKNLTLVTLNKIESVLNPVEKVPQDLANFLEYGSYDKTELFDILSSIVKSNLEIYGSTISFEPYMFEKESYYFAPYYYKSGAEIKFSYLDESYKYFDWDWYKSPKTLNKPVWSEPYFDKGGGNILMSTYSVPFYKSIDGKRIFAGVVTADVSLSWLQDIVSSIKIGKTGYGFMISKSGIVVTHPDKSLIVDGSIYNLAALRQDDDLKKIADSMIKGKSGFVSSKSVITGKLCWLSYAPLISTGWSLGVLFPQDELMADIVHLNIVVFSLGIAGLFLLLVIIVIISGTITRPLRILAQKTKDIAKGNLDFEISGIGSKDEVGKLAESFEYMKSSLKQYIKELTETTASKEKIESELKIAHDIQMSLVPHVFPQFLSKKDFDIYAVLEPAKAVGGDFYDFFFIDDTHLCFVIGDVSDKGVPAALFMAMTKTLLKLTARELKKPEDILSKVNKEISRDNKSCMFITIFCGILDINSGELVYANGGHNEPFIVKNNTDAEFLRCSRGPAIGIDAGAIYLSNKVYLKENDMIFTYTDGVTEAFNKNHELYSEDRLEDELSGGFRLTPEAITAKVLKSVQDFSLGVNQSDDITILAIKFLKSVERSSKSKVFVINNSIEQIEMLASELLKFGKDNSLGDDVMFNIHLAMEEVISNIILYGFNDKREHEIFVRLELDRNFIIVEVKDDGRPFNPLDLPKPDLNKPIEEKPIGGLGVYLVRALMDGVEYTRDGDHNILKMKKSTSDHNPGEIRL